MAAVERGWVDRFLIPSKPHLFFFPLSFYPCLHSFNQFIFPFYTYSSLTSSFLSFDHSFSIIQVLLSFCFYSFPPTILFNSFLLFLFSPLPYLSYPLYFCSILFPLSIILYDSFLFSVLSLILLTPYSFPIPSLLLSFYFLPSFSFFTLLNLPSN